MKTIKYHVSGLMPYDARINALLRGFDLGMKGAYIPQINLLTVTLSPDVTDAQIEQQPAAIAEAYAELGWIDVRVTVV